MVLLCTAIKKDSVSFMRFLFRNHVYIFSYAISPVRRMNYPYRWFFSQFFFPSYFVIFFFFFFLFCPYLCCQCRPTLTYSPSLARSGETTSLSLRDIWQTDSKPSTASTSFVWLPFSANTITFTYHPLFEFFFHRSYHNTLYCYIYAILNTGESYSSFFSWYLLYIYVISRM